MSGSYFYVLTILPRKTMKNNPKAAHFCCKTYRRLPTLSECACKVKDRVCQTEAEGGNIFQISNFRLAQITRIERMNMDFGAALLSSI